MNSAVMNRVKKIASRFGMRIGGREPTAPTLNLPDDWLAIRIPYERQDLSRVQRKAIQKSGGCQRSMIRSDRNSWEGLSLEAQIGRLASLGQGQQEMAIHIRREAIPTKRAEDDAHGAARNKRAVENINEMLAVFPDEQIEISRVDNFEVGTENLLTDDNKSEPATARNEGQFDDDTATEAQ